MSLATYEEARPWAKAIREEVLTRRMPKWHAARGYGDFSNDPSLSPFEIALIAAWADGGAPKGSDDDEAQGTKESGREEEDRSARDVRLACGDAPVPQGSLLAVRPLLERGASIGIAVELPDAKREIVAYVRDFDPDFADTYWLRAPIDLPRGSRLTARLFPKRQTLGSDGAGGRSCAVVATIRALR
jgi:hypothetical protein